MMVKRRKNGGVTYRRAQRNSRRLSFFIRGRIYSRISIGKGAYVSEIVNGLIITAALTYMDA